MLFENRFPLSNVRIISAKPGCSFASTTNSTSQISSSSWSRRRNTFSVNQKESCQALFTTGCEMDISIHQVQCRIAFLQEQLDSLEHYLPETYQYLMNEMDAQQRVLMELKISSYYQQQSNEHQDPITNSWDQTKGKKSDHRCQWVPWWLFSHWVGDTAVLWPPEG